MKNRRFPKKTKGKNKTEPKRELTNQNDFYEQGTFEEEQAERWLLSDVKKSLRYYVEAFKMYELGLSCMKESTERTIYNISYNESRLLLQIYTDYLANDGYINILQYIKLDDIPNVNEILKTLPTIVNNLENVYNKFINNAKIDTWDLQYNLLTSYLSLLESNETYQLSSGEIIQICNKFVEMSQLLIKRQINELENWLNFIPQEKKDQNDINLTKDTLNENSSSNNNVNKDGSGIILNPENNKPHEEEIMEVSDQITVETLSEVLLNCYKFIEVILEIIIQNKMIITDVSKVETLNVVQINYLCDLVDKLYAQIEDIIITELHGINLDLKDINVTKFSIEGDKKILQGDLDEFLKFEEIDITDPNWDISLAYQMIKIDALELSIDCFTNQDSMMEWELAGLLSKKLSIVSRLLSAKRSNILSNGKFDQLQMDQLSEIVFKLCNIYIINSDNELRRYMIKSTDNDATKLIKILMKNAKTLLSNGQTISKQSCGMQETIVDKLKRNYIYNQATTRLQMIERYEQERSGTTTDSPITHTDLESLDVTIQDLLRDHPFYSGLL